MNAVSPPRSTRAGKTDGGRGGAAPSAAALFLTLVPALLLGVLCLRGWGLWLELPVQPLSASAGAIGAALLGELIVFARGVPLLLLLSSPFLLLPAHWRIVAIALLWSVWLLVLIALEQYFLATRALLGADLFGYSWQEIGTTADGGLRRDAAALVGWVLPLFTLLAGLAWFARRPRHVRGAVAAAMLLAFAGTWMLPLPSAGRSAGEDVRNLVRNRLAFFAGDNLRYWGARGVAVPAPAAAVADATPNQAPQDPRYPFLHREQTPDVLGPLLAKASTPPHLVFIIVEGLGRTFSGPDAARGSFTPFLDELADRSLYWSNFLATQGRTFAVLPSVFGSLPFGEQGFAALGDRMPAHAGLFNVLERQGYTSRFYAGTDLSFDNERSYLRRQGVDRIVELADFDAGYRRNPYSSWGYDDNELISRVLADGAVGGAQPTITVIQTMSMHTSYRFAGQDAFRRRFERRLDELQVSDADRAGYREFADIYSTVLFTDDALRRYFTAASQAPGYANTVFVVTGDHRLPEIPMDTRIERYHVPLIVFSPLLRQPARIRAVSSHLDITPSLLAYLSNNYGLQRPEQVAWTGSGLDTSVEFRSGHDIPLKHAKTILGDFVSGPWFTSRDELYRLHDGMGIEPVDDAAASAQVANRFQRYRQANDQFAQTLRLSPEGDAPRLTAYAGAPQRQVPASMPASLAHHGLYAHDVAAPVGADAATVAISARFTNATRRTSASFVPLLVLSDTKGRQVCESYAAPLRLDPGGTAASHFDVNLEGVQPGRYFIAVLASHPDTGRRIGEGVYRVPLKVRCCAPGGGARVRP